MKTWVSTCGLPPKPYHSFGRNQPECLNITFGWNWNWTVTATLGIFDLKTKLNFGRFQLHDKEPLQISFKRIDFSCSNSSVEYCCLSTDAHHYIHCFSVGQKNEKCILLHCCCWQEQTENCIPLHLKPETRVLLNAKGFGVATSQMCGNNQNCPTGKVLN